MKPIEKSPEKNSRSIRLLLEKYHQSHLNSVNQKIHYICVPLIYWSITALFWPVKIPVPFFAPNLTNLSIIATITIHLYYLLKSFKVFIIMLSFTGLCLLINYWLENHTNYFFSMALAVFCLAWIGQFIGHKIEGQKPSFFQDLQFLLIGPAWVILKLLKQKI